MVVVPTVWGARWSYDETTSTRQTLPQRGRCPVQHTLARRRKTRAFRFAPLPGSFACDFAVLAHAALPPGARSAPSHRNKVGWPHNRLPRSRSPVPNTPCIQRGYGHSRRRSRHYYKFSSIICQPTRDDGATTVLALTAVTGTTTCLRRPFPTIERTLDGLWTRNPRGEHPTDRECTSPHSRLVQVLNFAHLGRLAVNSAP